MVGIKTKIVAWVLLAISAIPYLGMGQVQLPKLIGHGMVLQRNTELKLWGWASANEAVTISFLNNHYSTQANEKGEWEVLINEQKAGGPYRVTIEASNTIVLDSVYFGDVWICSGQSNMEITMERVSPLYQKEIAEANYTTIRYFYVPRDYDFNTQRTDFAYGEWKPATKDNILNFSAVSYFYGLELYKKYKVPIGLINTSLGGSPIECWLSEASLKQFPDQYNELQKFKDAHLIEQIIKDDQKRANDWQALLNKNDLGLTNNAQHWKNNECNTQHWKTMELPGFWTEKSNGVFYFKKEIDVLENMVGKPAKLNLGTIVDADSVFVNGVFVGNTTYQYPPRRYNVAPGILQKGKNTITIKVISQIGEGGFVMDKPYELVVENDTIDLKGYWRYAMGASMEPLAPQTFIRWKPGGLFNAMIYPLSNYSIKGFVWYQGESNVGRSVEYKKQFPELISCWRKQWNNENLPFVFAQLPNYLAHVNTPLPSDWAMLREAQASVLNIANTAMATTIDLGEWNDIHPLNKADVAKRLALGAAAVAYNDTTLVSAGPLFQSASTVGNKMILSFAHIGSGLMAKNGELKAFAIAGNDKKFVWAKAKIEGDKVVVWSDAVSSPKAVRYAWADNPDKANLYNNNGLPATPFRTDAWEK